MHIQSKVLVGLVSLLLAFTMGCGTFSPLRIFKRAEKKVDQTEKKIDDNHRKLDEKSKGYVYASDFSLSLDPAPNPFSKTAKEFTERSLLVTGNPDTESALVLRKLVNDLLSTNAIIRADAEKRLQEKDKEVIALEKDLNKLTADLDRANEKFKKVSEENTVLGQKWYNLWKWVKIIGITILVGFILSIVASALPPPYNSIVAIVSAPVGILIRFIIGAIPKIADFAHTVSKTTYEQTKAVSHDLVDVIQQFKETHPQTFDSHLEPLLKEVTSKEISRPKIEEIKKELGY